MPSEQRTLLSHLECSTAFRLRRAIDLGDRNALFLSASTDLVTLLDDPELMPRAPIVGYCFGIRSERRLCEEVHLNLAYRWFCRLSLDGAVPDHSTFSKNRHRRFRDSGLLRQPFEATVRRCMSEGLRGAAWALRLERKRTDVTAAI